MEPQMQNNQDLQMFMNYRRMRHIRRCNTLPCVAPIDVAQHSYYVTMLAMTITDEYNIYAEENNLGYHDEVTNNMKLLNAELVMRKSLLHDTEESIVSDIPWTVKHMNNEIHSALESAVDDRMNRAYSGTKTLQSYNELCKECKDGFEGAIVNLADMMELAIYCWEEIGMGNYSLMSMFNRCLSLIETYPYVNVLEIASPLFSSIRRMLLTNPVEASKTLYMTE